MQFPFEEQRHAMSETVPRALVIPGIQDTKQDWEALQLLLHENVELVFAAIPSYEKQDSASWRQARKASYEHTAMDEDCTIIMGHSWGTHLALEMLLHSPNVKGAILLNPPRNELSMNQVTLNSLRSREPDTFMEKLMWEQARDMSDEVFFPFAHRHETNYHLNKGRIRKEFGILKNSCSFECLMLSNHPLPPTMIVRAPCDPWHIDTLPGVGNLDMRTMDETYHYPHVSKPVQLAHMIQEWLNERILPPHPSKVMSETA